MEDGKCVSQYSVCVKREVPCVELRRVSWTETYIVCTRERFPPFKVPTALLYFGAGQYVVGTLMYILSK